MCSGYRSTSGYRGKNACDPGAVQRPCQLPHTLPAIPISYFVKAGYAIWCLPSQAGYGSLSVIDVMSSVVS